MLPVYTDGPALTQIQSHCGNIKNDTLPDAFLIDGKLVSDRKQIADALNDFFINIALKMTSSLDTPPKTFDSYLNNTYPAEFSFKSVDRNTVSKAIDSLKSKSTQDVYGLSTELIKMCKHEILDVLTKLINEAIATNHFPDELKIARVSAIYKKDDKRILDNYRPISILPAISKIYERILHDQLTEYFTCNNLLNQSQYGFRKQHDTDSAALEFIDRINEVISNRKKFLSIYMDLSKAFDSISHQILLEKLKYYGLRENAVQLIQSYLSNRKQFVEVDGHKSQLKPITIGVPQGSILGPLLFLIYINDIQNCTSILTAILYADDSTFSVCLDNTDTPLTSDTINMELNKINNWLNSNKLCLNVKKTKYMIFNRTHSIPDIKLEINGTELEEVKNFKFLGLTINNRLDWTPHTSSIQCKLARALGIMKSVKHLIPQCTMKTIYFSIFHPHIIFHILAWGHTGAPITRLQKFAIRTIHNEHYLAHTDPLFKNAGILKFDDLYLQSQLKLLYKHRTAQVPVYIANIPMSRPLDIHDHDTRYKTELHPLASTNYGGTTIRYSLPCLLNTMPAHLADLLNCTSVNNLKTEFKKRIILNYSDSCADEYCYPCEVRAQSLHH